MASASSPLCCEVPPLPSLQRLQTLPPPPPHTLYISFGQSKAQFKHELLVDYALFSPCLQFSSLNPWTLALVCCYQSGTSSRGSSAGACMLLCQSCEQKQVCARLSQGTTMVLTTMSVTLFESEAMTWLHLSMQQAENQHTPAADAEIPWPVQHTPPCWW